MCLIYKTSVVDGIGAKISVRISAANFDDGNLFQCKMLIVYSNNENDDNLRNCSKFKQAGKQ